MMSQEAEVEPKAAEFALEPYKAPVAKPELSDFYSIMHKLETQLQDLLKQPEYDANHPMNTKADDLVTLFENA